MKIDVCQNNSTKVYDIWFWSIWSLKPAVLQYLNLISVSSVDSFDTMLQCELVMPFTIGFCLFLKLN